MIDQILKIVAPISTAVVSYASVYFVMSKIDFPHAALFGAIIFVITLIQMWGDDKITEGRE